MYVWTALGPDLREGLSHILLPPLPAVSATVKGAGEWPRASPTSVLIWWVAVAPGTGQVSSQPSGFSPLPEVTDHAEPQVSGRTRVSTEATVTHWVGTGDHQAGGYGNT